MRMSNAARSRHAQALRSSRAPGLLRRFRPDLGAAGRTFHGLTTILLLLAAQIGGYRVNVVVEGCGICLALMQYCFARGESQ